MSKHEVAARQLGISTLNTRKSSFLWKISNVDLLKYKFGRLITPLPSGKIDKDYEIQSSLVKEIIVSPTFSASPDDLKWCLVMFCDKYHVSFEFRSKDSKYFTIDANISISILKHQGKITKHCCIKQCQDVISSRSGFLFQLIAISTLFSTSYHIMNRELQILCEYELIPDYGKNEIIPVENQVLTFENQDSINRSIVNTLTKQWTDREFCDYELIAPCGRKLSAHKLILSARSPVFSAMLKSGMIENRDNFVKIEDINYEALEEMLRFMYSGKLKNLEPKTIGGIVAAAEKYQIYNLKDVCKEFLQKHLCVDNAIDTLRICKTYSMTDLESHVNAFIRPNAKMIYCSNALIGVGKKQKCDDEADMYFKLICAEAEKIQPNN